MDENWNNPRTLHLWVDTTLDNAKGLSGLETASMRSLGHSLVDRGKLRGDISAAWHEMVPRVDMSMLDLYL